MPKFVFSILLVGFLITSLASSHAAPPKETRYLDAVTTFADTLLKNGLDTYGKRETAMWAAVIDTRDLSVPRKGTEPTKGVRACDRAVGGANLYHDVSTIRTFHALSKVTGDKKYAEAADAYLRDTLRYTQHKKTGLLGWGEHLYYDLWDDRVTICPERRKNPPSWFDMPHEFLAWTPPWEEMFAIDPERTAKAIESIRWHYNGPDPQVYLFNRHAAWDETKYQKQIMPWIKHAALFSYSYACLQAREPSAKTKHWMHHTGLLYWKLRDRDTGLVMGCLYHSSEPDAGKRTGTIGSAFYAYWLFKAGLKAKDDKLKSIATDLMKSVLTHAWDASEKDYASSMDMDTGKIRNKLKVWREGYSASNLWHLGRVSIYLARHTEDEAFRTAADRVAAIADRHELPDSYTAQNAADAINFYLDHYDLTGRDESLTRARHFADASMKTLIKNGLIVRKTGDTLYEAKLGAGDYLASLLRLHLRIDDAADPRTWDWSF